MSRTRTGKRQESKNQSSGAKPVPVNDGQLAKAVNRKHSNSKGKGKAEAVNPDLAAVGGALGDRKVVRDSKEFLMIHDYGAEDPSLSADVSLFLKNLDINDDKVPVGRKKKEREGQVQVHKIQSSNPQPRPSPPLHSSRPTHKPSKSPLVVEPVAQWYNILSPLSPIPVDASKITSSALTSLTTRASDLHVAACDAYQVASSSTALSSEASFLSKIISSGTLSDRLSALTLLVQGSPVHNTRALETLRGMAEKGKGKGGRSESLKALRCVVDWWVGGGAPDRKLRYFRDQPLSHRDITDKHLTLWYFEDWLKKYFFSVLRILEVLSLDPLPYVRTQALSLIFTLLRHKPEQEQNLLRLLVNKLGDIEKSVCSRASYYLLQLLQVHPSMKSVVIREMASLVFQPASRPVSIRSSESSNKHIHFGDDATQKPGKSTKVTAKRDRNEHACYYAAITLNQVVLNPADKAVALQLMDVYFEMFKELLGPGTDVEDQDKSEMTDVQDNNTNHGKGKTSAKVKGKVRSVHKRNKARLEAKERKGDAGFTEVESAQSRLISAILTGVNRALPFAKVQAGDDRLNKHIDTLFLITHTSTFNISLQALVLIQQICVSLCSSPSSSVSQPSMINLSTKSIIDRYYRALYASLHDSRLAASSKHAMFLNLFFKSLKADTDVARIVAFVKRFCQVMVAGSISAPEFIAGGLYLLGELYNTIPELRKTATVPADNESDYDPRKRDPQYAHAASTPLWELVPLLRHYHPTVSLHARQLLSGQPLTASPNLSLNTLSHFLDRFVYKNPKKAKAKGASVMQPAASETTPGTVKLMKGETGSADRNPMTTVNDEKWWGTRKESDVPADEVFFHKYFSTKYEREKARERKTTKKPHDDTVDGTAADSGPEENSNPQANAEDGSEEEEEDIDEADIWKAMKATMPREGHELLDDSDDDSVEMDPDEDGSASSGESGNDETATDSEEDDIERASFNGDVSSLASRSDDDDLVDLDAEVPSGLIDYDGPEESSANGEQWEGITAHSGGKKRKHEKEKDGKRNDRKKLRSLPTFASYEDYAKLIEEGPEDDI